jgi:hypothetical protein
MSRLPRFLFAILIGGAAGAGTKELLLRPEVAELRPPPAPRHLAPPPAPSPGPQEIP